ncbi:hypothetical protein [Haloflavibacter putidus]|uniref:Outer membrane lipoprotein-sorting protein n=1 Tax=Haloflavibacter putidus TaxID=2576776 RepID=A0A507ZA89_9FLAO|nr:hypothetical protein [Haloflavibacter putidus]TQD33979.1 hypothetical protein FKR84_12205 [Haloflavibacter putidus]
MHKITSLSFLLIALILFSACKDKPAEKTNNVAPKKTEETNKKLRPFIKNIAQTHEQEEFLKFDALGFNLALTLKDTKLEARFIQAIKQEKLLITKQNGNKIFFTEEGAFATPNSYSPTPTEKQALLWASLFTLPQKINTYKGDWTDKKEQILLEDTLTSFEFSPKENLKNSIKNLRVFTDKKTNLVKAVKVENASKVKPQTFVVFYEHYYTTKKIPVCSSWKIYSWSANTNKTDEQIGNARIENLKFLTGNYSSFKVPENARKIAI